MRSYLLLPLLFVAIASRAEESSACTAFRNNLVNKPRLQRDYSGDEARAYEMKAGVLSAPELKLREFSFFTAEKVKCGGRTATLEGTRRFAVVDNATHAVFQTNVADKAKISITILDEPLDAALPRLPSLLFWDSAKQAVDSVPDYVAKIVPAGFDSRSKQYVDCTVCGAGVPFPDSAGMVVIAKGSGLTPPQLIKHADPEFTEASRRLNNWHGVSRVGLIAGVDGMPHSLWLVRALGYGLDQNAAKAVSQYRFAPAMKDGHPVAVWLNVDVSFTMTPQ